MKLLKLIGVVGIITAFYFFAEFQTQGFRYYHLISNLPHDPRWEMPSLEPDQLGEINQRLDQPFTFLGSGGWCYAFLGQDQKTVIKFFKHSHLYPKNILKDFSFQKLLMKSPESNRYYFHPFNFTSCKLLYTHLQEQSGIYYLHLNKTTDIHPTITLYDNIGVRYTIDLNQTEFIVQEKAELIFSHIQKLTEQEDPTQAYQAVDAMVDCLLLMYQKGLRDTDNGLRNNFGFIGDQPVTIDLSSWVFDETIKQPSHYKKEVIIKTRRLSRWLEKYHPHLHEHLENRLCNILEES